MTHLRSAPATYESDTGTRRRLLDEAARLFYREGLTTTTMASIADRTGILKGSLYYHFESRDAIVDAYLTREAARRLAWLERSCRGATPRDQLLALVDAVARAVQRRAFRGCPLLNAATELPGDPVVTAHVRAVTQESLNLVSGRFAAAGSADPVRDARALSAALYGAVAAVQLGDGAGHEVAREQAEAVVLERCTSAVSRAA